MSFHSQSYQFDDVIVQLPQLVTEANSLIPAQAFHFLLSAIFNHEGDASAKAEALLPRITSHYETMV